MAKEVTFSIKLNVEGKEKLATVTASTKDLAEGLEEAKGSATRLQDAMVTFASIAAVGEKLNDVVSLLSEKLGEAARRSMTLQQQTGLTGEALSQMRAEVQAVADAYGKDFGEVMQGVSTLMKGFGVSADEAMRLVRDGMMSGADATGQMFDMLKEYPAYFKEAGLDAEQFMAIITNGAKMGVFNDKAADTIKEGNLRLREMTDATREALDGLGLDSETIEQQLRSGLMTTFDVMQMVGAKLKELPQTSAEVGTALADIFGGPGEDAGVAYIESLADMNLGMDALKENASDTAKAIDSQIGSMADFNGAVNAVVDRLNAIPGLQPFLGLTSQIGMTVVGVSSLVGSLKALNIVAGVTAVRTKAVAAASAAARAALIALKAVATLAAGGFSKAAVGATTLKVAIRGLMVASGVGIVITALAAAIEYLTSASDDAADELDSLKDAHDTFASSAADVQVELDNETKKLRKLIAAKEDTSKAVANLNSKYGDIFGSHKTASEWYDILTRKSKLYAKQVGYEAQAKVLATRMAETQIRLEENYAKRRALWASGGAQTEKTGLHVNEDGSTSEFTYKADSDELKAMKDEARPLVAEYKQLTSELDTVNRLMTDNARLLASDGGAGTQAAKGINVATASIKELEDELDKVEKKLKAATPGTADYKKLSSYYKQLKAQKDKLEKQSGLATDSSANKEPKFYKDPKTEAELSKNINYYSGKLTGNDTEAERQIQANIKKWEAMRDAIELAKKAAAVPTEIKTLDDIAAKIDYLTAKRKTASQQDIAQIDAEIQELETLQSQFAVKSIIDMPDSAIKSYEQLNVKLQYYNALMDKATSDADRSKWQGHIDTLSDIQEGWERVRQAAAKARETENLSIKPIKDVETKDIAKGSDDDRRQSYANAQSRANRIQGDLDMGLIDKKQARQQLDDLNKELASLGLKPLELRVDASGFDKAMGDIKDGWGSISGIGSGIESITSALEGQQDAWTTVSACINGALEIAEGISGIVSLINTLTAATTASSVASATKQATTAGETAATTAHASATAADTAATLTNTAAKSGEAVAEATSQGAKLPFPANIAAIAAGVAAVVAALAIVGSFATGGIVGGNSTSGDKLIARVNSGEMILNKQQQSRLFALLNGQYSIRMPHADTRRDDIPVATTMPSSLTGAAGGGKVSFKIKGRNLVGALANHTNISSKSGHRSNIIL